MFDGFRGDATRLDIPVHPEALRAAGPEFLTRAFRTFGSLGRGNAVTAIETIEMCPGGSTGAKLFLDIAYERPDPSLHRRLFVKFSRDFEDERRDNRGRWEMAGEARFAPLSRLQGFPIAVPAAYFADYEQASGSGLVITQRIAYGEGNVEPQRRKCLDHLTLDEPLDHYRQVVTALARLAAAHKSGRLATDIEARFPFDPATDSADPIRYSLPELRDELDRCFDFAARCPHLLPEEVRSAEFHAQLAADALLIFGQEAAIQHFLQSDPRMIALCHWNAHIDNCWFERGANGELHCGLTDWGRAGQITLGSALWGGLSAAHHSVWDEHLDDLLALFVREYAAHGGPAITVEELLFHLRLHLAAMGVARVLAFPEVVLFRLPECIHATGCDDPMFLPVAADPARNSLHIYTVFLKFWRRYDVGGAVRELLARQAQA
ncbi:MAG: hypothetical protein AB7F98_03190 [Novosphingobium sp.]